MGKTIDFLSFETGKFIYYSVNICLIHMCTLCIMYMCVQTTFLFVVFLKITLDYLLWSFP